MEALLQGSKVVSDELSRRILGAESARPASAESPQAELSETCSGQATPSFAGEPDSRPPSKPSHGFSFRKAAAAVSAASIKPSAGLHLVDEAVASTDAASAPADLPAAEAQTPVAAPAAPSGDTDLDVFVAKLTLQALEQQREVTGRSLESDVWPVGSGGADDPADPPRLDWQSELDLIKRTGETWERRRARMAAERAAAAAGRPSDAGPSEASVSHASTKASEPLVWSSGTQTSTPGSADTAQTPGSAQEHSAHDRMDSADSVSDPAAGPTEELDIIDMIAAGGGYKAGSSVSENAWLDGDDESDNDTVTDVRAQSSAVDDVLVDASHSDPGSDRRHDDAAQTLSDHEPEPSPPSSSEPSRRLPWGADGRAYSSQQVKFSHSCSRRGTLRD